MLGRVRTAYGYIHYKLQQESAKMMRKSVFILPGVFMVALLACSAKSAWAIDKSGIEQKHSVRFQIKDAEQSLPDEARCNVTVYKRTEGKWQEVWEKRVEIGKTFYSKLVAGKYRVRAELGDWDKEVRHTEAVKKFKVPNTQKVRLLIKKAHVHSIQLKIVDAAGKPVPNCRIKLIYDFQGDERGDGRFLNTKSDEQVKRTNHQGIVQFKYVGALPTLFDAISLGKRVKMKKLVPMERALPRWQKGKPVIMEAEREQLNGTIKCLVRAQSETLPMKEGLRKLFEERRCVPGISLLLRSIPGRQHCSAAAIKNGEAELYDLENGNYKAELFYKGNTLKPAGARNTIRIKNGELVGPSRMVFYWPGESNVPVTFHVVDGDKNGPLPNAKIAKKGPERAHRKSVRKNNRTNENGRLKRKLNPGEYTFIISHRLFPPKKVNFAVKKGENSVQITLDKKSPTMEGVVRTGGQPTKGVSIDAKYLIDDADNYHGRAGSRDQTDRHGHYEILLPRNVENEDIIFLRISRDKFSRTTFSELRAVSANATNGMWVPIKLEPQLKLKVQFVGKYSNLLNEGGGLWIIPADSGHLSGTYRIPRGNNQFVITPVPGRYELYFRPRKDINADSPRIMYILGKQKLREEQSHLTLRIDEKPETLSKLKLLKKLEARRNRPPKYRPIKKIIPRKRQEKRVSGKTGETLDPEKGSGLLAVLKMAAIVGGLGAAILAMIIITRKSHDST